MKRSSCCCGLRLCMTLLELPFCCSRWLMREPAEELADSVLYCCLKFDPRLHCLCLSGAFAEDVGKLTILEPDVTWWLKIESTPTVVLF